MTYAISYRSKRPVQIYYEDIGDPSLPILVMQHGDGNDSQNWKTLGYVERLAPHFRLILIDYLGYGRSEKVYEPAAYALPLLAGDTIAVLKHLGITKPVTFFGGSMGGRVGYELATTPEYAKFFNGFIINGMGPSGVDIIVEFGKWVEAGGMEEVVKQMEATFMVEPFSPELKATFLRNDPKAYRAANLHPWPDISEKLPSIDKPVLLIVGEFAGERADMENAVKLIPNAELKMIPGLDHAQAYWRGKQVVPLMLGFLKK